MPRAYTLADVLGTMNTDPNGPISDSVDTDPVDQLVLVFEQPVAEDDVLPPVVTILAANSNQYSNGFFSEFQWS